MANKYEKKGMGMAIGILIGMIMGVPLWMMSDNLVWLAIGFAIGAGIENNNKKKREDND